MGRAPALTKLGSTRVRPVRCRGGNIKYRALRLDSGSYSWGSECVTRRTRILQVVYNASNNELVRTNTLVKNSIVMIDATPFKQWYATHYGVELGRKKTTNDQENQEDKQDEAVKLSKSVIRKRESRVQLQKLDPLLEEQFNSGRLLACISSRPGQIGRADGYILEGIELQFYKRKLEKKKSK